MQGTIRKVIGLGQTRGVMMGARDRRMGGTIYKRPMNSHQFSDCPILFSVSVVTSSVIIAKAACLTVRRAWNSSPGCASSQVASTTPLLSMHCEDVSFARLDTAYTIVRRFYIPQADLD